MSPIYFLLILALASAGVAFTCRFFQGYAQLFGAYHDDAIYTICAQALASGHGYRIISLPMEPLQTKYPPLFPLFLSLAFRLNPSFPANIALLELISCLAGLAFLFTGGYLLIKTRRATPLMALSVVAATWLNLDFLSFLPVPMADLSFAALSAVCIWLCEKAAREKQLPATRTPQPALKRYLMVGALLSAAGLTHAMGFSLLAACLIYLLLARRIQGFTIVLVVCSLVLGPYWLWANAHAYRSPPVMAYYTNYFLAMSQTTSEVGGPFYFVFRNLPSSFTESLDSVFQILKSLNLPGEPPALPETLLYGSLWGLLLAGVGHELARKPERRLLAIWLLALALTHLSMPGSVGRRHLLTVLPFVYYFFLRGLRGLGWYLKRHFVASKRRWQMSPRHYSRLSAAAVLITVAALMAGNLREDQLWAGQYRFPVPRPTNASMNYSESSEFAEAYDWIRSHTPYDAVLIWNNDPNAYLWTGRKAMMSCLGAYWKVYSNPPEAITSDDLITSIAIGQGTYLVIDPISSTGLAGFNQLGAAVESLMKDRPGLLRPVFTSRFGLITIFKINLAPENLGKAFEHQ